MLKCPLCASEGAFAPLSHDAWKSRRFWLCPTCDVVFVDPSDLVSVDKERERYATHQNGVEAPGFLQFLAPTVARIREHLAPGSRVLDFGSGPEPTLSRLLVEAGYDVVSYDPHFSPVAYQGKFDLILLHEVFEHLREPAREIDRLRHELKPGGTLVIRSELRPTLAEFPRWWYARDLTHILFSSEKTLNWMAHRWGWRLKMWSTVLWSFETEGK